LGKVREVESEEDKRAKDEGKRVELMRMVGKSMAMNRELEKLQEVIEELREELGM
jgi:uncharacterized protein YeeX (DUF496 family)